MMILMLAIVGQASATTCLKVKPVEVKAGGSAVLEVSVHSATEMTALQFCLQLPDGLSIDESKGIQLREAADNSHRLINRKMTNGDVIFFISSADLKCFKDGELLRIPIKVSSDAKTMGVRLYNVRTSPAFTLSRVCADEHFIVTVLPNSTTHGDVNNDGAVDVADIASVISVMAGTEEFTAADVNSDGTVDVADIATIIDIMAGK